jgi:hypothetical protein
MDLVEDAVEAALRSRGGDLGALAAAYRRAGLAQPTIRLAPEPDGLPLAQHRDLLAWWRQLSAAGGLPPAQLITPDGLRTHLGRLIVLEPVDDGADFRYRLYGSVVAQFTGFDLTGWLLSRTETQPYWPALVTAYYFVTYRAAYRARQPLYSAVQLAGTTSPYVWHRLLLPFVGPDGAVSRLLLCTVPCDLDSTPLPAWQTMQD